MNPSNGHHASGPAKTADPKAPPSDPEAEAAVLSSVMIDPSAITEVRDLLRPEHFCIEANRRIYEACLAVDDAGRTIDLVAVAYTMRDSGRLDQVGGMPYLTEVLNGSPAVSRVRDYARAVYDLWRMRECLWAASKIVATGNARAVAAADFGEFAERTILGVTENVESRGELEQVKASLNRVYTGTKEAYETGIVPGIPTGLRELDQILVGLHKSEFTLAAARPGVGKSSILSCIAVNVAKTVPPMFDAHNRPSRPQAAAIFSLEMPRDQVTLRMLASEARVSVTGLRTGQVRDSDWSALTAAAVVLSELHIYIDDTPALHISSLAARARRLKRHLDKQGVDLVLVAADYVQLMTADGENVRSREQALGVVSRGCKQIAKDLDVAFLGAAQLNRQVEDRANKRPQLPDLRETGALEQDADNVLFLYRPSPQESAQMPPEDEGTTEIIVAKQRNGPTDTALVRYRPGFCRFENR